MNRYIKFDSDRFLKDSRHWSKQIEELELEKASITEIGGSGEGIPSGNEVSRPTERVALLRNQIQAKINKIYDFQTCMKYAWESISEEDRILLTGFYFAPGYIYQYVEIWCASNATNRQYCYQAKREALQRFGNACEKWMEMQGYER